MGGPLYQYGYGYGYGRMGLARRRGIAAAALVVASASVADNVAAGTVITPILAPAGYSLLLLNDCGARFAISGTDLVTGTTILEPGTHQPVVYAYRTAPVAAGPDCFEVAPVITAVATRVPSDISGLVMSHRTDDAVLSGNNITSIPGAHGTAITLTGAGTLPTIDPNNPPRGPSGKRWSNHGATRARYTFTSQAPTDSTWVFCFAPNAIVTLDRTLVSDNSATNSIDIGASVTEFSASLKIRTTGMGAAATLNLALGRQLVGLAKQIMTLIVTIDTTNDLATAYVNGGAGDSVALTGATAQAWTNLMSNSAVGNQSTGLYMASLLYNKVLSATERAQVFAMMTPWRTREHYFSAAGSDSNHGFNADYPKLLVDTYINTIPVYPGDRIWLNGGDRFPVAAASGIQPYTAGTASFGFPTNPVLLKSYGSGRAILSKSTKKAAGSAAWTSIGGGVWTTAFTGVGAVPNAVWVMTGGADADTGAPLFTTLQSAAVAGGQWRHAWAANVLSIRLDDVLDPNTLDIEIPNANSNSIWTNTRDNWTMEDLILLGGEIATQAGGDNAHIHRSLAYCFSGDVWNWQSGVGHIASSLRAYRQGPVPSNWQPGSTGADGVTSHGNAADLYNSIFKESYSFGGADQQPGYGKYFDCKFLSNAKAFVKLSTTTPGAPIDFTRCEIERPAVTTNGTDTFDDAILVGNTALVATVVTVKDTKFTGLGTTRGKCINKQASAAVIVDAGGNSFTGFSSLS